MKHEKLLYWLISGSFCFVFVVVVSCLKDSEIQRAKLNALGDCFFRVGQTVTQEYCDGVAKRLGIYKEEK